MRKCTQRSVFGPLVQYECSHDRIFEADLRFPMNDKSANLRSQDMVRDDAKDTNQQELVDLFYEIGGPHYKK